MVDVRTVWSQPQPVQAVQWTEDHGHGADDAAFLIEVARWIVLRGGECTLRYLGEKPYPDDPGETMPHVELLIPYDEDNEICQIALEPGWWVVHHGHDSFSFLDQEVFDKLFTMEPPTYTGTVQDGLLPGGGFTIKVPTIKYDAEKPFDIGDVKPVQTIGEIAANMAGAFSVADALDIERGAPYLESQPLHAGDTVGVEIDGKVHLTKFDPGAAVDITRKDPPEDPPALDACPVGQAPLTAADGPRACSCVTVDDAPAHEFDPSAVHPDLCVVCGYIANAGNHGTPAAPEDPHGWTPGGEQ